MISSRRLPPSVPSLQSLRGGCSLHKESVCSLPEPSIPSGNIAKLFAHNHAMHHYLHIFTCVLHAGPCQLSSPRWMWPRRRRCRVKGGSSVPAVAASCQTAKYAWHSLQVFSMLGWTCRADSRAMGTSMSCLCQGRHCPSLLLLLQGSGRKHQGAGCSEG